MARYPARDAARLREVEAELGCIRESARSALEWLAPTLRDVLGTEKVEGAGLQWGLSRREIEVLVALAQGMPTRTIAATLGISERTVETHLTSMFEKAQVETRAELVAKAVWG